MPIFLYGARISAIAVFFASSILLTQRIGFMLLILAEIRYRSMNLVFIIGSNVDTKIRRVSMFAAIICSLLRFAGETRDNFEERSATLMILESEFGL